MPDETAKPRRAGRDGRRGAIAGQLGAFRSLAGNRALVRVLAGYALFILTEYSVWVAMLVFAYSHGGATTAALVALAQLVPAAVAAPVAAGIADRRSPAFLLAGGYLVQAAAMAATAVAVYSGTVIAAYAAAVLASTAVTTTRPAQSMLMPALAATPDQLTAANVVAGWAEAAGTTAAGLLTGGLIWLGGVGSVFAVCAGLGGAAALLIARLARTAGFPAGDQAGRSAARGGPAESSPAESSAAESSESADDNAPAGPGRLGDGLRLAVRQPRLRLMLALLTAEAVVIGALDLLFVVLAVGVLGRSQAWAGYLNSAFGVGAMLAAGGSAVLVGRRLGGPILGAAVVFSGALAALALGVGTAGTAAILAAAGAGHALLDVASRTLLQRSVPPRLTGRVFGVLEGLTMAGLALGALLVPALMALGGSRLALLGVAAVLPLAGLAGGRALLSLDAGVPVPVVQIGLLRSLPLFAELPPPAIEGLAAALTAVHVPAGTVLIRQGDPGDVYYAIAAGELDASQDGRFLRRCGRGEGVGEIALLRAIPRTATVTARTDATVYELSRDLFLTSVLGHAATRRQADHIADARLAAGPAPGPGRPGPGRPGVPGGRA
ncbi:MAG TPA: cyclic nucleotide-binding domain-containing protein [Streptosporangiaceae bacterium]